MRDGSGIALFAEDVTRALQLFFFFFFYKWPHKSLGAGSRAALGKITTKSGILNLKKKS
jgi:hypothetical protein